jgi:hypothetical protein
MQDEFLRERISAVGSYGKILEIVFDDMYREFETSYNKKFHKLGNLHCIIKYKDIDDNVMFYCVPR